MHDTAFTFFSGLGLILISISIPLQWKARNVPTLLNLGWLFLIDLVCFVNSIIWWDSYENVAPIWCDISIKIISAFSTGLASSSLCINRRLARITTTSAQSSHQAVSRTQTIDLIIGLGMPLFTMVLSYVFQQHRFNIIEGVGCEPPVWPCLPSILTLYLIPIVMSAISAIYGGIAIRFLLTQHMRFRSVLRAPSQNGLDMAQYLRLILLASADLLFLPISVFYLVTAVTAIRPWVSWQYVHSKWSSTVSFNSQQILPSTLYSTLHYLPRWLAPVLCFLAFLFFGVGEDAVKTYDRWFRRITFTFFQTKYPADQERRPLRLMLQSSVASPTGSTWASLAPGQHRTTERGPEEDTAAHQVHSTAAVSIRMTVERSVT